MSVQLYSTYIKKLLQDINTIYLTRVLSVPRAVHSSIEIRLECNVSRVFQASFWRLPSERLLKKPRKPLKGGKRIPSRKITAIEMQKFFLFQTTEYEGSSTDHEGNIRQLTGKGKKLVGIEP
jgi:hypothetical protein